MDIVTITILREYDIANKSTNVKKELPGVLILIPVDLAVEQQLVVVSLDTVKVVHLAILSVEME
jgi:hypothetical protein